MGEKQETLRDIWRLSTGTKNICENEALRTIEYNDIKLAKTYKAKIDMARIIYEQYFIYKDYLYILKNELRQVDRYDIRAIVIKTKQTVELLYKSCII